ncbi:MAG: hypothetical protein RIR01_1246 [Bacteroidota bacterium]|jgi:hypothetical protein
MEMDKIKKIAEELKEGATLAFYSKKKWYTKIIPFFSQEVKGENPPSHVGLCLNINREKNSCEFYLSENGFSNGKYIRVKINNFDHYAFFGWIKDEEQWLADRLNNYEDIIVKNLKTPLTADQIQLGIKDAKSQIGKKYNYLQFFFAAEFFEKILPKFILKKLGKSKQHICSMHILHCYKKMGLIKQIPSGITSPNELIKLDIFE